MLDPLLGVRQLGWRLTPAWLARRILDRKYFLPHPESVREQILGLARDSSSKFVRINDVTLRVPVEWKCSTPVPLERRGHLRPPSGMHVIVCPPSGFYMNWESYRWAEDAPEQLAEQIRQQARHRRWIIHVLETVNRNGITMVDARTEARNGVTHRFINFYQAPHEYFCEIKADTPLLYTSARPLFDAVIETIRIV